MVNAIAWIIGNGYLVLFVVAVCTTLAKVRRERPPDVAGAAYIAWGELLFYAIGIWFVSAGIMHAYFQDLAAPKIGWQPSPFEYELGWIELPLGVVAMMSLWRGSEFRLATTLIASTFTLAAAAQHLQQMICCANYAPSNAGPVLWFGDIVIPVLLLVLAALSRARKLGLTLR